LTLCEGAAQGGDGRCEGGADDDDSSQLKTKPQVHRDELRLTRVLDLSGNASVGKRASDVIVAESKLQWQDLFVLVPSRAMGVLSVESEPHNELEQMPKSQLDLCCCKSIILHSTLSCAATHDDDAIIYTRCTSQQLRLSSSSSLID
jgi:hypothetical protein